MEDGVLALGRGSAGLLMSGPHLTSLPRPFPAW